MQRPTPKEVVALRPIDSFNTEIQNTFNTLKISTRQKLVGSSAITGNIITNDYDLNELVQHNGNEQIILQHIYLTFKKKFEMIYATTDIWIVDFKCGQKYGEPIRWERYDIIRGTINGTLFTDCILQKSVCKIDVVKYLNGRFIEISEIYYFNINGQTNYDKDEFKLPYIIHEIEKDREELLQEGNKFKAMKREYRILDLMHSGQSKRSKLTEIFNGLLGWLYYCISNLKTLIIMKDQSFRIVPFQIFYKVQQTIKDDIARVVSYPLSIKTLDKKSTVTSIQILVDKLTSILNNKL